MSAAELKQLRTLVKDYCSVKTLHNWEQGGRKPTGAARMLLRKVSRQPELVLEEALA